MRTTSRSSSLGKIPHLVPYLSLIMVSNLGNWIQSFSEQWIVLLLSGPEAARWAGRLSLASGLALLVFLPFGGMLTDRFDHRKVVTLAQGSLVLSALSMGLLARHSCLTLHGLMGFAVFAGVAAAVSMPTSFRFLREIVPVERIPEAYALLIFQYDLSRMAGPSLAALLIPLFGISGNFFLNAASFLPGLLWMGWYMARHPLPRPAGGGRDAEASYDAVFRVVRSSPALEACLALTACFGLFAWNHLALLPVCATRYLGLGSRGMASLMTLLGFGAIWASLWVARGRIANYKRWIGACFALYGVLLLLWGICPGIHAAYALCAFIGPIQAMMWLLLNGQVQRLAPAHLSGRMAALFLNLCMGLMPLGNLASGEAAQGLGPQGPRWVLAAGGFLLLAAAALFHLHPWEPVPAVERSRGTGVEEAVPDVADAEQG